MTNTLTPCQRETVGAYLVTETKARPFIVRIERDAIFFRVKGTRSWYKLPIEAAFRYAVAREVMPAELPPKAPQIKCIEADDTRRKFKMQDGQRELEFDTPP